MAVDADSTTIPVSETSPNVAGLLPCPFCLGHPEAHTYEDEFWIACTSCGATGEKCEPFEFVDQTVASAKAWAKRMWNTRAKVTS